MEQWMKMIVRNKAQIQLNKLLWLQCKMVAQLMKHLKQPQQFTIKWTLNVMIVI